MLYRIHKQCISDHLFANVRIMVISECSGPELGDLLKEKKYDTNHWISLKTLKY